MGLAYARISLDVLGRALGLHNANVSLANVMPPGYDDIVHNRAVLLLDSPDFPEVQTQLGMAPSFVELYLAQTPHGVTLRDIAWTGEVLETSAYPIRTRVKGEKDVLLGQRGFYKLDNGTGSGPSPGPPGPDSGPDGHDDDGDDDDNGGNDDDGGRPVPMPPTPPAYPDTMSPQNEFRRHETPASHPALAEDSDG